MEDGDELLDVGWGRALLRHEGVLYLADGDARSRLEAPEGLDRARLVAEGREALVAAAGATYLLAPDRAPRELPVPEATRRSWWVDERRAIALTSRQALRTRDGGDRWEPLPLPLTLPQEGPTLVVERGDEVGFGAESLRCQGELRCVIGRGLYVEGWGPQVRVEGPGRVPFRRPDRPRPPPSPPALACDPGEPPEVEAPETRLPPLERPLRVREGRGRTDGSIVERLQTHSLGHAEVEIAVDGTRRLSWSARVGEETWEGATPLPPVPALPPYVAPPSVDDANDRDAVRAWVARMSAETRAREATPALRLLSVTRRGAWFEQCQDEEGCQAVWVAPGEGLVARGHRGPPRAAPPYFEGTSAFLHAEGFRMTVERVTDGGELEALGRLHLTPTQTLAVSTSGPPTLLAAMETAGGQLRRRSIVASWRLDRFDEGSRWVEGAFGVAPPLCAPGPPGEGEQPVVAVYGWPSQRTAMEPGPYAGTNRYLDDPWGHIDHYRLGPGGTWCLAARSYRAHDTGLQTRLRRVDDRPVLVDGDGRRCVLQSGAGDARP